MESVRTLRVRGRAADSFADIRKLEHVHLDSTVHHIGLVQARLNLAMEEAHKRCSRTSCASTLPCLGRKMLVSVTYPVK